MRRPALAALDAGTGGNVTLNTLRKVVGFLPNLQDFTFEQVRMKPTYVELPPFEWMQFYMLSALEKTLRGITAAVQAWLDNPRNRGSIRSCSPTAPQTWPPISSKPSPRPSAR